MVRLKGIFGIRKVLAKHSQKVALVQGQSLWQPVIDALEHRLKEPLWQKASVKITISNALVRYTLLPWSETILSAEEEQRFVKFKMDEVFGISDKNFEISVAANSYGASRLACAIETDLLNKLYQLAITYSLDIQSIQPQLIHALNFWRKGFKAKQLYFMFADGEKLCTTFISKGRLQHLRVEQINKELSEELIESVLQREQLINQSIDKTAPVYLYATKKPQKANTISTPIYQFLNLPVNHIHSPDAFLVAGHPA